MCKVLNHGTLCNTDDDEVVAGSSTMFLGSLVEAVVCTSWPEHDDGRASLLPNI